LHGDKAIRAPATQQHSGEPERRDRDHDRRRPGRGVSGTVLALLLFAQSAHATARVIASHGDAFVAHDDGSRVWTIGNGVIAATFGVGTDDLLTLADAIDPRSGRSLNIAHGLDTTITLNDTTMTLGGPSHGLAFVDATADAPAISRLAVSMC